MVDGTGSDHETWVDGSSNDPTKGVPGSVIKPIVEIVEALFCEVLCCTVIEVGIKLMNNRFEPASCKIYVKTLS